MNLGFGELLLILVIVLVLFGAGRLPALGKGLGEAIRGFKQGMKGEEPPSPPISDAPRSGAVEGAPGPKKELPPDGGAPK